MCEPICESAPGRRCKPSRELEVRACAGAGVYTLTTYGPHELALKMDPPGLRCGEVRYALVVGPYIRPTTPTSHLRSTL